MLRSSALIRRLLPACLPLCFAACSDGKPDSPIQSGTPDRTDDSTGTGADSGSDTDPCAAPAPVVTITAPAADQAVLTGQTLALTGAAESAISAPDTLQSRWLVDGAEIAAGLSAEWTVDAPGVRLLTLSVTDACGQTGADQRTLTAADPPVSAVTIWGAAEGVPLSTWNGLSAADGLLWAASGAGLIRIDPDAGADTGAGDSAIRVYTSADGLLQDIAQSVLAHPDGTLWVGHAADAVQQGWRFTVNADGSLAPLLAIDYTESTEITGIYRLRAQPWGAGIGDVWMGTNEGACLYDSDLAVFAEHAHPTHPHELSLGVAFTPDGHVWNLDQYQLSRWRYSDDGDLSPSADLAEFWIPYEVTAGTPIYGRDMDSDGWDLYLASQLYGMARVSVGADVGASTTRALGLPFPASAYAVRNDGVGNLWIGALDGLYVYDIARNRIAAVPLALQAPFVQLAVDPSTLPPAIWAAGADGFARISGVPEGLAWTEDAIPAI